MPDHNVASSNGFIDNSTDDDDDPDERDQRSLLSKNNRSEKNSKAQKKPLFWKNRPKRRSSRRKWQRSNSIASVNGGEGSVVASIRHLFGLSWLNILFIFVPFGISAHVAGLKNPTFVFALNALAIIPLTRLLTYSTECVAQNLGTGFGAFLNITFGNLVELVILVFMLREGHIRLVKASLLGSILVNLLFILGIALMSAGLRHSEQVYDQKNIQVLVFFMTTGILCILIPTSLRACIARTSLADAMTLKFSRGLSIVLLVAYVIFAHFQTRLQSHGPIPQDIEMSPVESEDDSSQTIQVDDLRSSRKKFSKSAEPPEEEFQMNKFVSLSTLLLSAGIVSVCAEFMVDSIEHVIADAPLTEAFLGLIILPLLGNVAELATAVTVANKQKIDLAINVVVGSSIQITTFMAPFCVLLGWILGKELSLYFDMFQTVTLFSCTLIVIIMLLSGRTHYLLGVLLCICYLVIGTGAFFMPNQKSTNVYRY